MTPFLSVGGPVPSLGGGFDFAALVWVLLALAVTRFILKLPLTIASVTVSLIAATLWWAAVQQWGPVLPSLGLLLGLWLVARALPARRPES